MMPKPDNETLQLALIALITLSMMVQAIVLLATYLALRKAARSANEKLEALRTSVMPLVDKASTLVTHMAPKIEATTDDISALAHSLRVQTAEVQAAANDIVTRVRSQAGRLDTMFSHVLDTAERASDFMADAVNKPIRQISAVLASVKAVVESLRDYQPASRSNSNRASGDHDLFV